MTKGFFRERKHYSLQEITDNLTKPKYGRNQTHCRDS